MEFVQNVPFFCIMLSMFSGTVSSVLPGKFARWLNAAMLSAVTVLSGWLLVYLLGSGIGSYIYMMGHFPAPWGNELRIGVLEAGMALFFSIIMLLSILGGKKKLDREVEPTKHNIYYILCNLLLSSLLALVYTNDLFTAYVFLEINTIAACAIVGRCVLLRTDRRGWKPVGGILIHWLTMCALFLGPLFDRCLIDRSVGQHLFQKIHCSLHFFPRSPAPPDLLRLNLIHGSFKLCILNEIRAAQLIEQHANPAPRRGIVVFHRFNVQDVTVPIQLEERPGDVFQV